MPSRENPWSLRARQGRRKTPPNSLERQRTENETRRRQKAIPKEKEVEKMRRMEWASRVTRSPKKIATHINPVGENPLWFKKKKGEGAMKSAARAQPTG